MYYLHTVYLYFLLVIVIWSSGVDAVRNNSTTCVPILLSSTCRQCMSLPNTTYCPRSATCLYVRNNGTYIEPYQFQSICDAECVGRLLYSTDQCSKETVDVTALVFSFILLILCPLCIISGCLYMIVLRCRGHSKIAVDGEAVAVVATAGIVVHEAHHIPVMATAQVIRDEEIQQIQMTNIPMSSPQQHQGGGTIAVATAQAVRPSHSMGGGGYPTVTAAATATSVSYSTQGLNNPHRYNAVPTGTIAMPPTGINYNV